MKGSYISALEKQAQWFSWGSEWLAGMAMEPWERKRFDEDYYAAMATYVAALGKADTIYMNAKFCELVDHARMSVPDDLEFEEQWMVCDNGFVVLETPFKIPQMPLFPGIELSISAVAWMKTDQGYYFMCFQDFGIFDIARQGFSAWTHFQFKAGEKLIDRIRDFEAQARVDEDCGSYELGRDSEMLHEMRWIFTALHLMSQKMTHISEHQTSWMARDMARRKQLKIAPRLKVVSLRRMEEARKQAGVEEHKNVDWQWQWVVEGHWRLQPYRTLKDYKWIFIEAYIKGPDNKPLKPDVPTIYKAVR